MAKIPTVKPLFGKQFNFHFLAELTKGDPSGIRDGNFKPLVADSTDFEPLLNVSAWDEGNCKLRSSFGVQSRGR